MAYATALSDYADAGGYDLEVTWDVCTTSSMGLPFDRARYRLLSTLSGGEQKRLVLEYLLRGPDQVLLLDEPDNYLDVPGKIWLEGRIRESAKTILFISHDRELLDNTATRIVTVELGSAGNLVWTHPGGFASYHEARSDRFERFEEMRRRWDEEHAKIKALVLRLKIKSEYNDGMSSQYRAAQTRLKKFEDAGPPIEQPREQQVTMRLKGGRTGKRAVVCTDLELTGLMKPFDLEVWYGERVAVLGSNGSGKSHFLRLLAAGGSDPDIEHQPVGAPPKPVPHTGKAKLGARVRPGWFVQTHEHPELLGRTLLEILHRGDDHRDGMGREAASRVLDRYELAHAGEQTLRVAQRRPAGALPDPAARALRRDPAAARRAHRQPRRAVGRGAGGRARGLRRHGARGDPRPVVRPRLRPVPGLRRRRRGLRVRRPGVGRGPGGALAMSTPPAGLEIRDLDPFDDAALDAWHHVYAVAEATTSAPAATPWQLEEVRAMMQDTGSHAWHGRLVGRRRRRRPWAPGWMRTPLLDNLELAELDGPRRRPTAGAGDRHGAPRARSRRRRVVAGSARCSPALVGVGVRRRTARRARGRARASPARAATTWRSPRCSASSRSRSTTPCWPGSRTRPPSRTRRTSCGPGSARCPTSCCRGGPSSPRRWRPRRRRATWSSSRRRSAPTAVREREATLARQGRTKYNTVALSAAGEVVAYSDLATTIHEPGRAYQWGTLVRRQDRGHRLGVAVKVANLRLLQRERPDIVRLTTYNAEVNAHMIGVNEAMGFVPIARLGDFQKKLDRVPEPELVRLVADDWEDFRQVRLASLADSPQAFGARHADWVDATEEQWRARLTDVPLTLVGRSEGRLVGVVCGMPSESQV